MKNINFDFNSISRENTAFCFMLFLYEKSIKETLSDKTKKFLSLSYTKDFLNIKKDIENFILERDLILSVIENCHKLLTKINISDRLYLQDKFGQNRIEFTEEYRKDGHSYYRYTERALKNFGYQLAVAGINNDKLKYIKGSVADALRSLSAKRLKHTEHLTGLEGG